MVEEERHTTRMGKCEENKDNSEKKSNNIRIKIKKMEFRKRKRIKIIIKNEINQPVVAFILVC
jgi:beta-lactamase regulating signal transducer with metallopeptidase domain